MKRIIITLVIILTISFALTGCGGKESTKIDDNSPVTGPVTEGTIELEDGKEINFGTGKSGESMDLPEDFPVDILPLLDDAKINFVNVNDSNKGIGVTFLTDTSFDEVVIFYKEVMKDGKINMETEEENLYMVAGTKGSYSVIISATYQPGVGLAVLLDATPLSN